MLTISAKDSALALNKFMTSWQKNAKPVEQINITLKKNIPASKRRKTNQIAKMTSFTQNLNASASKTTKNVTRTST